MAQLSLAYQVWPLFKIIKGVQIIFGSCDFVQNLIIIIKLQMQKGKSMQHFGNSKAIKNPSSKSRNQVPLDKSQANTKRDLNTSQTKADFGSFPSIMSSIPLMLQYKKNKIIQNTLTDNYENIDQWKIGKFISQGSTATVYKAFDIRTGKIAAIKKIIYDKQDEEICKKQMKILSKIKHKNVVQYYGHLQVGVETWIFMEYVQSTLTKYVYQYGPPPLDIYRNFAKQLIIAVDYLHQDKIVHKDIKCSNILLGDDGILKLSDFGCSKGFDQTISFQQYQKQGCRTFKGSILWMAPEVIRQNIYNRKTDIWSLGCSLLELATGNSPWAQKKFDNQMAALWIIASGNDSPLIPQQLPEPIKQLIKPCLQLDPTLRPLTKQLLQLPIFRQN